MPPFYLLEIFISEDTTLFHTTQNHSLIDIYHAGFHGGADNFVHNALFSEMASGYFSTNWSRLGITAS